MNTELDLAVARLMEWDELAPGSWVGAGARWIIGQADGGNCPLFIPSQTMMCADYILDHIAALGWAVTVFTGGWGGKHLIRCCILRTPTLSNPVDVVAETRPLAICRAFIQAMERWGDG